MTTMRRREILFGGAAAAIAIGAAGCNRGGGDDSDSGSGGKKPYIAIVSKGFQHQFWQTVKKGAEEEAKKLGARVTFEGPATESDVEDQITMLQNALSKNPDAIGFAALDSKASESLLKQADSQGIPIIAFDSGVDSDIPLTTAATDNKAAAADAAKHMAKLIGNKGKVGLVVHDQTSLSGRDRRDGFVEWMKKNAPDVELMEPQYGGGDQNKSASLAKSMLTADPKIAGIYGSNEGSAIGVVKGVKEAGLDGKVVVVGFDSGKAQLDAIKDGTEAGAISQNPIGIGKKVVEAAMKAIDGKGDSLPKQIDTGFYWYDKKNMDEPKIKEVLYE